MNNKKSFWSRLQSAFSDNEQINKTAETRIEGVDNSTYMSPSQPVMPVVTGVDPSQARTRDYAVGENQRQTPRGTELTRFQQLRDLAEFCALVRIVINKRKGQISQLKYQFVIKDGKDTITDSPEVKRIEEFFRKPDRKNNLDVWWNMIIEDLLVIDAPTVNVVRTVGGDIYKLRVVDGATIKPLINEWGETPDDGISPAYQQEIKGTILNNFTTNELIYRPMNVRAHKLYGYSPVEQIIRTINLALRKENEQLSYFAEGNLPNTLIGTPVDWQPDQIKEFQLYWDEQNKGGDKKVAKAIPGGAVIHNTKPEPLKDEFDDWYARIICAGFSISPSAFIKEMNKATAETHQASAKEEGLEVLKEWLRNFMNEILKDHFQTNVEFEWSVEEEKDPMEVATILQMYVTMGVKTINEARSELGLPPLSEKELPAPNKANNSNSDNEDDSDTLAEKVFKKKSGKVDINDLEIIKTAQKKLEDILNKYFLAQKESVIQYVNNLKISKSDNIEDELDLVGDATLIAIVIKAVKEYLTTIAVVSYKYTLKYIGKAPALVDSIDTLDALVFHDISGALLDNPLVVLPEAEAIIAIKSEKKAMEYAGRRSAELIGKRVLKDGSIVDNPKASYAISDTTREGIEGLIDNAIENGLSNKELADMIEENYLFSEKRAMMVARTETNLADNNISVDTYSSAGIARKRWLTAHDDKVDPCCTNNEKQGAINMDSKFSSGSIAPPAHPNCRCTILAVFDDE